MSCIFGIFSLNNQPRSINHLEQMKARLNHWDANDVGLWYNQKIGLGHLMLWNTPESLNEKLPYHNNLSSCTITADARIDNREDLFKVLNLNTETYKNLPDSSLILKAYEKYGQDCTKHIRGDFAFVIWNEQKQELFCARDHFGIRPFFYFKNEDYFIFASEKKGLLALKSWLPEIGIINETYMMQMVCMPPDKYWTTLYTNIFRLKTAHTLVITKEIFSEKKYWEPNTEKRVVFKNEEDYFLKFKEKFDQAIKVRLRSNNSISTELSGGIDSSTITCRAADLLSRENKKLSTLSFTTNNEDKLGSEPEERDNEFIEEVIKFTGIEKHINLKTNGYKNWQEEIALLLEIYDGPDFTTTSWSFPLKREAAASGSSVLLSGFGGDHGVTCFSNSFFLDALAENNFIKYYLQAKGIISHTEIIKNLISNKLSFIIDKILYSRRLNKVRSEILNSHRNFLLPEFAKSLVNNIHEVYKPPKSFRELQKKNIIDEHLFLRVEGENLAGYKYKLDTRFPMLDIDLLEYVIAIPAHVKNTKTVDRYLIRKSLQGLVPSKVLNEQDYTGASMPFAFKYWLQTQNEKLQWLNEDKIRTKVPKYLNFDKIKKGYNFDNKVSNNDFILTRRLLCEMIIYFNTI